MQVIVITPPQAVANEIEIIIQLFQKGLRRLHVRKPGWTAAELEQYIATIPPTFHRRIVIHSHFGLLSSFDLGGIHLNSFIKDDPKCWQEINAVSPQHISASFHTWAEVLACTVPYGYLFISPVFNSISKPGYNATIDLSMATQVHNSLTVNRGYCPAIVALGGINVANVSLLRDSGFQGAALLGGIWGEPDMVAAFVSVLDAVA